MHSALHDGDKADVVNDDVDLKVQTIFLKLTIEKKEKRADNRATKYSQTVLINCCDL